MSKWLKKYIILFSNFYSASESLRQIEMYKVISENMAISENTFGHFKAKISPIEEFFTFSSHFDVRLLKSINKF